MRHHGKQVKMQMCYKIIDKGGGVGPLCLRLQLLHCVIIPDAHDLLPKSSCLDIQSDNSKFSCLQITVSVVTHLDGIVVLAACGFDTTAFVSCGAV